MIPLPIRVLAIVASFAYLWSILVALRGSQMNVRQSLLWIVTGVFFLVVSLLPQPIIWLAGRLGFVAPSNAGFIVWLLVLTALLFYQSLTTSRQAAQLKALAQELALLHAQPPRRAEEQT